MALNINGTTGISGVDGSASAPALTGTDSNTGINFGSDTVNINTGGSTRATVDSAGRVGIGVSDVSNYWEGGDQLVVKDTGTGGCGITIHADTDDESGIFFADGTTGNAKYEGYIQYHHSDNSLRLATGAVERGRITNDGTFFLGLTSEPGSGDAGVMLSSTIYTSVARVTTASAVFRAFGSDGEFRSLGNGNCQNTYNSYGAISDRELKENEVDANSQWNDIKALKIKNYNLKAKPDDKQLGVVAQDLEASGMNGLVENNPDEVYTADDVLPEGKKIGDVKEKGYKSVKYSVLYMKSVKALQEAIAKIETLETKVAALEAG